MKTKRALICIAGALLFLASAFRPGYRIIVDGQVLPGIYDTDTALRCNRAAIRAAEEITREHEDPPYTLVPVLCLKHTEADEKQLWGILLNSYEGVEKLYTVSIGDTQIGTVSNLRQLFLIKNRYMPAWSSDQKLTIHEIYTYAEAETPSEEIETAFQILCGQGKNL